MDIGGVITRSFERLGMRGAPALLNQLSRFNKGRVDTATLPSGETISFPACDPYWCRYLYAGVPYEPDVEAILKRYAPGRVLIDCGANIGYWSVRARGLGFRNAIAIEANAGHIALLRRNYAGRVIHAAVHARSEEMLAFDGDGATGAVGPDGQPVPSLALADLDIIGPCLVKLDIEGVEIPAIEGAAGLDAIFVYEDWPRSGMPVTHWLLERGYCIRGFDESRIETLQEAFDFNRRTNSRYGPSNLVAFSRQPASICEAQ